MHSYSMSGEGCVLNAGEDLVICDTKTMKEKKVSQISSAHEVGTSLRSLHMAVYSISIV